MSTFAASFALYTLLVVLIGVYSARYARRSDEDYFLAGRSLGPWVAALSASASSESGWVTLGLIGWAFTSGVSAYWIIPGCLGGFIFNWFVLAGRLRRQSQAVGALTLPDFFAFTFRERLPLLRGLSVIVILVAMLLYVAAQFAAAGKAFEAAFDGVRYQVGVVIGAVIVLVYTVLGGFRAACWTDLVQGLIMVGTLVLFPLFLLISVGGYDFVAVETATVGRAYLDFLPLSDGRGAAALIGFLLGSGALGINLGYPGQPHVLVRFMALADPAEARLGGIISVVWATLVYWGAVTVGLVVRAMTQADLAGSAEFAWTGVLAGELAAAAPDAGETGLVLAAQNLIPGVFSGMVLAAVLAAICSTADSQLVVAASAAANDVYVRLVERSGRLGHLLVNRLTVLALGVGAVLLVVDTRVKLFEFVLEYGWAVLGASFGPQLILILLWKRATYAGCVAGMLTGFAVSLLWKLLDLQRYAGDFPVYNLTLGFALALAVNVAVSLVTRPPAARAAP